MARIRRRFFAPFQLRDLCSEMPIHKLADIPRGTAQNPAQTCHGFAAGMIDFCERLCRGALAVALDHMSDRLRAGKACKFSTWDGLLLKQVLDRTY